MKASHHDFEVELRDDWWGEAGMLGFRTSLNCYRGDASAFPNKRIFSVSIEEVEPVRRNLSAGVFNDNEEASAHDRVVRILRGFQADAEIPPVEVVSMSPDSRFKYKLVHGAHRFYCSLIAGFSHVPAVQGFAMSALDR